MEREDARKLSPDAQREGRRQVVRAYQRGVKQRQIERELGLSYSSVRMVVQRFKQDGMRGICSSCSGSIHGLCLPAFRVGPYPSRERLALHYASQSCAQQCNSSQPVARSDADSRLADRFEPPDARDHAATTNSTSVRPLAPC